MSREETIKQDLLAQFAGLNDKILIQRPRRIFVQAEPENFRAVFQYAAQQLNFSHLCTITGLDEGDNLGFIYHLADTEGVLLNIKIQVSKSNPVIKTVTELFPAAAIYEWEIMDLLGAKVDGVVPGPRYPLTDDWPQGQYPLRKDWKPEMLEKGGDSHAR